MAQQNEPLVQPEDLDMPRQITANWELFAHAVAP